MTPRWLNFLVSVTLVSVLVSCEGPFVPFEFDNAVDPEAPHYQGTIAVQDFADFEILSPEAGYVGTDPFSQSLEVRMTELAGANAYQVRFTTDEAGTVVAYESPEYEGSSFSLPVVEAMRGELWMQARAKKGAVWSSWTKSRVCTVDRTLPVLTSVGSGVGSLVVGWDVFPGATDYLVLYGTDPDLSKAQQVAIVADSSSSTATLDGLTGGSSYYLWLRAKKDGAESATSNSLQATPFDALPVLTSSGSDGVIVVSWKAVSGADSYELWWGTSDKLADASVFDGSLKDNQAVISNLVNGTTYYLWVKAKNSSGNLLSTQASVQTVGRPSVVLVPGDSNLKVSWASVLGAATYEVWYGTKDDLASASQFGGDLVVLTETVTGLKNGSTYFVWVKAKNPSGTVASTAATTALVGGTVAGIDLKLSPPTVSLAGPTRLFLYSEPTYSVTSQLSGDSFQWFVDGVLVQKGKDASYGKAASLRLGLGKHTLSVLVQSGDRKSSLSLPLDVAQAVYGDPGQAGGILFYDKGSYSEGWRYMECSPTDLFPGAAAYISLPTEGYFAGANEADSGLVNTRRIVTDVGPGWYAASLCQDLVLGGKDDWFLPSKPELHRMVDAASVKPASFGFSDRYYWSSTSYYLRSEYAKVWTVNLSTGEDFCFSGYLALRDIRAVRVF